MTPTAGKLTERVRFERRAAASDGYGNTEGAWETLIDSRRASLRPTKGGELVIADRLQGQASFDLWVYSDSATRQLTTDDRAVDARDPRRTFNILFIGDLIGDGRWLFMQAQQGGASG